jgi:hypothetical protein
MAGLGADKERALEAQREQLKVELLRVAGAGEDEESRLEEALRRDFQAIHLSQQQAHLTGQIQSQSPPITSATVSNYYEGPIDVVSPG